MLPETFTSVEQLIEDMETFVEWPDPNDGGTPEPDRSEYPVLPPLDPPLQAWEIPL